MLLMMLLLTLPEIIANPLVQNLRIPYSYVGNTSHKSQVLDAS
jgi:hypothetical protein